MTESDNHTSLLIGQGLDGSVRSLEAHMVVVEEFAAEVSFLRGRGVELEDYQEAMYKRQLADLIVWEPAYASKALSCLRSNGVSGWRLWRRLWLSCLKRYLRRLLQ